MYISFTNVDLVSYMSLGVDLLLFLRKCRLYLQKGNKSIRMVKNCGSSHVAVLGRAFGALIFLMLFSKSST